MRTILGIITVVLVFVGIFTIMNIVGQEVQGNTNINNDSKLLITNINKKMGSDFDVAVFEEPDSSLAKNSTFEGVDAYARQYLEDKSEIEKKYDMVNSVTNIPDLIILSLGVPVTWVSAIKAFVVAILGLLVGLAIYVAIRTGEVAEPK